MNDKQKIIVAKLETIKEMADEKSVKQLADVTIEYIKSEAKVDMGFKAQAKKK